MRIAGVCLMLGAAVMAGCGGDGGDGPTPPPTPVFTSITLEPAAPTVVVGFTTPLTATAKDQNGATMAGMTTAYVSSDLSKATVNPTTGVVTGVAAGTSRITVTGTVGSVSKTANVDVTVTAAAAAVNVAATAGNQFTPQQAVVSRNGTVTWTFAILHNVRFAATTGAPQDIPDTGTGSVSRQFPTAGTFAYQCTIHSGMNGSVVVTP